MSSIEAVQTQLFAALDGLEADNGALMSVWDRLSAGSANVRSTLDRGVGYVTHTDATEAMFACINDIHNASEALTAAIANLRDVGANL